MADAFDIYQTAQGYVAITNPVRRQILDALSEGPKELPELMALTGKAKPTLSSVHMKELLNQRVIEAAPHATDSRRKVYRIVGQKIGSSSVPVETLRDAVKQYVSISPLAARFPLGLSFQAIAAAPEGIDPAVLRQQAAVLGRHTGTLLSIKGPDELIMGLVPFLEQEGIARALRLDLEHGAIELAFGEALPEGIAPERLGEILVGFLHGITVAKGITVALRLEAIEGERRCRIHLGPAT